MALADDIFFVKNHCAHAHKDDCNPCIHVLRVCEAAEANTGMTERARTLAKMATQLYCTWIRHEVDDIDHEQAVIEAERLMMLAERRVRERG